MLLGWASSYVLAAMAPAATTELLVQLYQRLAASGGHSAVVLGLPLAGLLIAINACTLVLYQFWGVCRRWVAAILTIDLDGALLAASSSVAYEYLNDSRFYDDLQKARGAGERAAAWWSTYLQLIHDVLVVVALSGLLTQVAWWFPLLLWLGGVPIALISKKAASMRREFQLSQFAPARVADYLRSLLLDAASQREVRILQIGDHLRQQLRSALTALSSARVHFAGRNALSEVPMTVTPYVLELGAVLVLTARVEVGGVSAAVAIGLMAGTLGVLQNIPVLGDAATALIEAGQWLRDYRNFVAQIPAEERATGDRLFPERLTCGIILRDVAYTYPAGHRGLKGLTATIPAGKVTALIGPNGAGKSTLALLLLQLLHPQRGEILVDGVPLLDFEPTSFRRRTAVVFQDFAKPELPIGEVIGWGDVDAWASGERVEQAAYRAGLGDVVANLPRGMLTPLGKRFHEDGFEPSGGLWQRIAIARALFRNASFLVLDEPAASLDPMSEAELYRQFASALEGVTAVLVTHRLGAARHADHIIVMSEGECVEEGCHDDLVAKGGLYAEMYRAQRVWYYPQGDAGAQL